MPPRAPSSLPRQRPRHGRGHRGAVLIVALLLAALIAIGLGSYINLNLSSARLARRSFNGFAALNLAEAGTEEAVWSFNRTLSGDPNAWASWTKSGSAALQKFTGFDLGQNTTGAVKVYVDSFNPAPTAQPKIVAQSSITAPNEPPVTKMIEVTLRRRSLFANGLVAKESVAFSGSNATVDSWNSNPDNNPLTPPVPYDPSIRRDRGTVASTAVVNTAVLVNQANIWGYVATGGAQPQVGPGGTIRGADSPANVAIDPKHVSTDFNADFAIVLAPADGTILAQVPAVLGVPGMKTKWRAPGITLSGGDTLTILGDVTLVLTAGSATDAISVTGNAAILIPTGSTFTVYAEGNLKIAGKGLANSNVQPASCHIFGTSTSPGAQSIQIAGNGALKCALYAPNGNVKINGNGDVMGSIVADKITLVGNAAFHYDEALAAPDANQPFSISKWRELTSASDRSAYAPLFDGW